MSPVHDAAMDEPHTAPTPDDPRQDSRARGNPPTGSPLPNGPRLYDSALNRPIPHVVPSAGTGLSMSGETPAPLGVPSRRLEFAQTLRLEPLSSAALADALVALFDAPPEPIRALLRGSAWGIGRDVALDCCALLIEEADRRRAVGECVESFALLGVESQLIDQLIGEGLD
jgi:hypothetical protein